jgi:hypothetical protein
MTFHQPGSSQRNPLGEQDSEPEFCDIAPYISKNKNWCLPSIECMALQAKHFPSVADDTGTDKELSSIYSQRFSTQWIDIEVCDTQAVLSLLNTGSFNGNILPLRASEAVNREPHNPAMQHNKVAVHEAN